MAFLTSEDILFHLFAAIATISAFLVVFMANPIYSALFLALTMSVLGVLFFMLNAAFVAVAQVTVYAGAVMVLFVMVIMLFDLKREHEDIVKVSPVSLAKVLSVALLCGFLVGVGWLAVSASQTNLSTVVAPALTAKELEKSSLPLAGVPSVKSPVSPEAAASAAAADAAMAAAPMNAAAPGGSTNPDEDLTSAEAAKLVDSGVASAAVANTTEIKPSSQKEEEFGSTATLSRRLFSKYVFAFEAVSLLLLVAIVGAVALAKSKGGTHHAT